MKILYSTILAIVQKKYSKHPLFFRIEASLSFQLLDDMIEDNLEGLWSEIKVEKYLYK